MFFNKRKKKPMAKKKQVKTLVEKRAIDLDQAILAHERSAKEINSKLSKLSNPYNTGFLMDSSSLTAQKARQGGSSFATTFNPFYFTPGTISTTSPQEMAREVMDRTSGLLEGYSYNYADTPAGFQFQVIDPNRDVALYDESGIIKLYELQHPITTANRIMADIHHKIKPLSGGLTGRLMTSMAYDVSYVNGVDDNLVTSS